MNKPLQLVGRVIFCLWVILLIAGALRAEDTPERVIFAGIGYAGTESLKPEAGFAGIAAKVTDKAGDWYSYTALAVTAKSNDIKTGILKPLASYGSLQAYAFGTAGIVTEGQNEVTPAGVTFTGSTVGFGVSGGVLATVPFDAAMKSIRLPFRWQGVSLFGGGQVLGNNVGTQGIDVGGQKVAIGFGVAIPLGAVQ